MTDVSDAQQLANWRLNPARMVRELFGVEPDLWQLRALKSFARQDTMRLRVALQACVGPGKTAVLAWIGWNFLLCYGNEERHPSGLCVSISGDNLRDNLWKEFAVWREISPLLSSLFEQTSERLFKKGHQKTWFIQARSWPRSANAEAQGRSLSGLHSDFILYLIDESGDIPPSVLRAAEQGLSSCVWGRIVQAGNPTSHDGMLYHAAAKQPHLWDVIRITGDPDDAERSPRIDIEWARQQIAEYGRDNAWVKATILGQFPDTAINALIGIEDLNAAMKRHLRAEEYNTIQKRIGIDIAREGDDATVLFPRQGRAIFNCVEMRDAKGPQVAARIAMGKQKFGSEMECIDSTGGHASSVIDSCALGGIYLFEVNFSGKADDPRYFNKRSEMYFRMTEAIKGGAALPNDPQLVRELLAQRFWFDKGKLRLLEKEQVKKQLQGHSPDRSDALATTYAVVELPARTVDGVDLGGLPFGKAQSDWDPYDTPSTGSNSGTRSSR